MDSESMKLFTPLVAERIDEYLLDMYRNKARVLLKEGRYVFDGCDGFVCAYPLRKAYRMFYSKTADEWAESGLLFEPPPKPKRESPKKRTIEDDIMQFLKHIHVGLRE